MISKGLQTVRSSNLLLSVAPNRDKGSRMQPQANEQQRIWRTLAELFFLDNEPQEEDFDYAAGLLKDAGWDRKNTRKMLVECIAPVAGANPGRLLWPVIGEWAGFDSADLFQKIQKRMLSREIRPKWRYLFSDWYCERILKTLGIDRLINRL